MSLATAQDDRGTVPVQQLVDQNTHTLVTTIRQRGSLRSKSVLTGSAGPVIGFAQLEEVGLVHADFLVGLESIQNAGCRDDQPSPRWNPLAPGANSIDSTDSSTTPRNASDTQTSLLLLDLANAHGG